MKKYVILFLAVLVIIGSILIIPPVMDSITNVKLGCNSENVANAAVGKVLTQVGKKAAIKSMSFVIERKTKKTVKDLSKKAIIPGPKYKHQIDHHFIKLKKPGVLQPVRMNTLKKPEKWTASESFLLETAIEKNIERKLLAPNPIGVWGKVLDWFTDWRFISGGGALLIGYLTGTDQLDIDEIVFKSLEDAGLLRPAIPLDADLDGFRHIESADEYWFDEISEDRSSQYNNYFDEYPILSDSYISTFTNFKDNYLFGSVEFHGDEIININNKMIVLEFKNTATGKVPYHISSFIAEGENFTLNLGVYLDSLLNVLRFNKSYIDPVESYIFFNNELKETLNYNGSFTSDQFNFENLYERVLRTFQRIKVMSPVLSGGEIITIYEFSNSVDKLKVITFYDYESKPPTMDMNYLSYEHSLKDDDNLGNSDFHYRVIPNEFDTDYLPKRTVDDLEISHGELDKKGQIHLPSLPNIPMTDVKTGNQVFPKLNPDTGQVNIVDKDGNVVLEEDVEVGKIPGGLTDDEPKIPSYPKPGENEFPDPKPTNPGNIPTIEPEPPPPGHGDGGSGETGTPSLESGCDKEINGEKWTKIVQGISTKFPFSIPWDVGRALNSLFGGMGSEKPEWKLPVFNTEFTIKIPDFIDNWRPFVHSIILFSFDVGIIYALRKWWGGQE